MNGANILIYSWVFITYNIAWLCCIKSKNTIPLLALSIAITIPICYYFRRIDHSMILSSILAVGGYGIDSMLHYFSLIQFSYGTKKVFAPRWLFVLWLVFALIYCHAGTTLFNQPYLLACLAAVGFPSTYLIGCKLGAANHTKPIFWPTMTAAHTLYITLFSLTAHHLLN